MTAKIDSFLGEYWFLSNFSSSLVIYNSMPCSTVEHAFQAAKTLDVQKSQIIALAPSPHEAKRRGCIVELRPDWEQVKVNIMRLLLTQKFFTRSLLAQQLLATKDAELVEGNHWGDRFWGVCGGQGENQLGRLLMAQRESLRLTP